MFFLDGSVFEQLGHGWKLYGIVKILVIIATLQIVKKLPEIINMIFGTNIKDRGGIKGRLGEMAGIGGIAQKAWTSLGAGAKNLAKAGLMAPAAVGFAGADAVYKKKHDGKSLKDTKLFRQAKGVGQGLSTAWKTGSPLKAYDAYDKGTAAPSYTVGQRLAAKEAITNKIREGSKDVTGRELFDSSGNFINQWTDKNGNVNYVPLSEVEKQQARLTDQLKARGDAGKYKAQEKEAELVKAQLAGIDAKNKAAIESLQKYRDMHTGSNYDEDRKIAGQIQTKINKGQKLSDAENQWLTHQSEVEQDADVKMAMEQMTKMNTQAADIARRFSQYYDGSTAQLSLGTAMGVQDGIIAAAKNRYEQASQNLSTVDKDAIDTISASYESTFKPNVGAYQNNGQITEIMSHFGAYTDPQTKQTYTGDVRYDAQSGNYLNVHGDALTGPITGLLDLVRTGSIKTSVEDYYGTGLEDNYVEEFASFASTAKNDASANAKYRIESDAMAAAIAQGVSPADAAPGNATFDKLYEKLFDEEYNTYYSQEYYESLHNTFRNTYGQGCSKANDPRAATIMSNLNRMNASGLIPKK